ncbi:MULTISPECIES: HAD family hydrolase [unclassified Chelatococcus]|uniref:HAD family hydrolase n=1 Tax=unclassified Chelatococcus TaxID=2638111 RepID=UPI001BCD7DAA|nr:MULTISPECIES: HAD family hydrolase [unclassified Chelatococcus]MBS7698374.1 haloacid dehalogenase-like hydrolase [Chelatococcus sp. YT9]MBX3558859.1 haloacid dehalogenase-like hydrolase [Chelatococcus sp.]
MVTTVRSWSRRGLVALGFGLALTFSAIGVFEPLPAVAQTDPLPSWNDGRTKSAILDFVRRVTTEGGADFVPIEERVATFDNDGTLWSEQPMYFQVAFAMDRVKEMAATNPALRDTQPFKAVIEGDRAALAALGEKGLLDIVALTHSGTSVADFDAIVRKWLATARHPRFDRPYTELVFQPMLELLNYLRANGFKTFVVSGGGIEFMRPWVPATYGIPPEQIVGSSGKTIFKLNNDKPVIEKLPAVEFVDDGPGKPVGINRFIGRRPVFAAGNSDGDLQMLQWTTLNTGPRFGLLVHHTDSVREWAYDRQSEVGRLDKALDEAPRRGWTVVDMKNDWKVIYPFQK